MQIREAITEVVGGEQLFIIAKVSTNWRRGTLYITLTVQALENLTNRQLANIGASISHIVRAYVV